MIKSDRKNYALRKILIALSNIVSEKHLTFQEISDLAQKRFGISITPYQVRTVANGKFQESKVVPTLDIYIDAILKVMDMTDIEFLNRAVAFINSNLLDGAEVKKFDSMDRPLREFVENPENVQYLRFAYKLYETKQKELELKKMQQELK